VGTQRSTLITSILILTQDASNSYVFFITFRAALTLIHNFSEQALRWSVIFRKVTNGFRSDWGRDLFAAVRSIVNTGKRQGLSAFESILTALNPLESLFPLS
jgi:hypothetical protein